MASRIAMTQRLLTWLATALPFAVVCMAAPPDHGDGSLGAVRMELRPPTRAIADVVRIADVADLSGGDESLRQRIADLDLEDAPQASQSLKVTAPQLEFRLRLAGIDPRLVSIRGSAVSVSGKGAAIRSASFSNRPDEPKASTPLPSRSQAEGQPVAASETEQALLAAVKERLKKQLPWPEENIVVQLAQPLPRELRDESPHSESATYSAELRSSGTPLGRVVARILRKAPGQRTVDVSVSVDVRHFEEVVVATKPLARGHLIAASDLVMGWHDVTQLTGYCTSPEQLVGQKAKRILPAEQIVRAVDVELVARAAEPALVKRRDRVKVIARSGALLVTVVGEAMQDGRAGEVIKVRNVDSNSFLFGRVLSATEVEVPE